MNMFINKDFTTCSVQLDGFIPLTDELAAKLSQYRPYTKAVLDESGTLIDIVEDTDRKEKGEARKADREQKEQLEEARHLRKKYFNAFDIYKSNLLYFNEEESEEEHLEIVEWYNTLLDITEDVTAENVPEFPEVPLKIQQYL